MNLVRMNYDLQPQDVSVVIYVGVEFTRLIFMRGDHFYQFAPILGEGYDSPNLQNTVYSRLLLEQDNLAIPRINRIILAGESQRIGFKEFLTAAAAGPGDRLPACPDAGYKPALGRPAGSDLRVRRSHRRGLEDPGPRQTRTSTASTCFRRTSGRGSGSSSLPGTATCSCACSSCPRSSSPGRSRRRTGRSRR